MPPTRTQQNLLDFSKAGMMVTGFMQWPLSQAILARETEEHQFEA